MEESIEKSIALDLKIIAKQLCLLNKRNYDNEKSWIEMDERLSKRNQESKQ